MKIVRYDNDALAALLRYRSNARRLKAKVDRYAASGAGDVRSLVGSQEKRLRDGDFRIFFLETETEIFVTKIGPRGRIYER
jgi:mRNA interferase RelE/StbE